MHYLTHYDIQRKKIKLLINIIILNALFENGDEILLEWK